MIMITVKYIGPSYTKGSRLVASDGRNRVTISYPHNVGGGNDRVHFAAVIALAAKCEHWRGCHFVAGYNETLKQHGFTWIGHVGNRVSDQVAGLLGDQVFTTPGEHIDAYRRRELAAQKNAVVA